MLEEQIPQEVAAQLVDNTTATGSETPMDLPTLNEHIRRGNFYAALLCYRPVSHPHQKITGAELLPRIVDPATGHIAGMAQFGSVATEHAKWSDISRTIIDHAADTARQMKGFHISLNLSARMIDKGDEFIETVMEILHEHDIRNPSVISFEVLEFVDTIRGSRAETLRRIRGCGIRLGLDDYGEANSPRLLHEMEQEGVTPDILKISSRITQSAGNGKGEIRRCLDMGQRKGIRHFIAEGSTEHPVHKRHLTGLAELQKEYGGGIVLEMEGPVVPAR